MRRSHGAPRRRERPLAGELAEEDEAAGVRLVGVLDGGPGRHGGKDVEYGGVLAQDADGAQRVQVDGAGPAAAAAQEGGGKLARAVVEGDVVWVRGYARVVKGDEDVNVGDGFLGGLLLGEIGGEGAHEEVGDFFFVPGLGHGIGKVGAARG